MFSVPKNLPEKSYHLLDGYRCRYIKAGLINQVRHLVHIYANPYICKGLSSTKSYRICAPTPMLL